MIVRSAVLLMLVMFGGCSPDQYVHPAAVNDQTRDATALSAQDRSFIEKAAQGNNAEVANGGLADARSTNSSVIAFGRMMAADHGAANDRLAEIARLHMIALPSSLGDHQAGYDRLVDRKGSDFDSEFVRVMVEDHDMARQLYQQEIVSGVDPMLREYAASMLPKIEAHLAQARTIIVPAKP